VLAALAVLAALLVYWQAWTPREDAPAGPRADSRGEVRAPAPLLEEPGQAAEVVEIGREAPVPRPELRPFDEHRLDGRGRIRGFVSTTSGIEFPQIWQLSLTPSKVLIGGERAESRTLEFQSGEQEFELDDLPLGGYQVRASSFGLSSSAQELMLSKPAEDDVYLFISMTPTGFIEGRALDELGRPVEELPLVLLSKPAGSRRDVKTNPGGHFLIDDVRDGLYELHVGSPQSPILPPVEIGFRGPSERVPDLVLPLLGELALTVVDDAQRAVAGATIRGYGDHGGSIEMTSDERGEARARFLPTGRYTVLASDKAGHSGTARQLLAKGERAALIVRLER
jgi:hypothetical protein